LPGVLGFWGFGVLGFKGEEVGELEEDAGTAGVGNKGRGERRSGRQVG